MLRWLQKKLPKVATLWAKLCAIAVGAHATLLFLLFFVYKGNFSDLKLEINANCDKNALVVFMPFKKTADNRSSGSTCPKGLRRTSKKNQPAKKSIKSKVEKIDKGPTSLAAPKKANSKIKVKKAEKKTAKKEAIKQDKKKDIKDKEVVKPAKPEEPKKIEPIKPEEPVKEEPIAPIVEDIKTTSTEVAQEIDATMEEQNIRYIGQAELDAMCLQEGLTAAISQYWKPPVGVAKNCVCELLIVVDWQGKAKDLNVQKPSGSAMYDVSTRSAALMTEYPKGLWGKSFTVAFKPSLR